ncbi:MAG: hormogonium polysaccharide secretion pseudopilin HpsC [Trichocoleus desertorum ATA4-8-CV12]|nr:hormogonium polysaccharide secretion pseudopilin HpsC [Trichocoleus desertorum ATA4-8-CV12]
MKLPRSKSSGFTLIELLVAMIISAIVLSALLTFMVDILRTDRREQAKSSSEQELQAALDYITRDLQQAVYIYDATGVAAIRNQLPDPSATDEMPVLVFWKREFLQNARPVSTGFDDQFVYSLVSYYLIKDPSCQTSSWSCTARVGRFQVKDGISTESGYLSGYEPDAGFRLFSIGSSNSISTSMNQWTKNGTYSTGIDTLVDFVDHTKISDVSAGAQTALNPVCPSNTQQIPQYGSGSGGSVATEAFKTGSFYACVDSSKTIAKVYLRGNAFARTLNKSQMASRAQYRQTLSPFFPNVSAQVQGRGLLGSN